MAASNPQFKHRKTRVLFICHDGRMYGSQKSLELLVKHLPKDRYEVMVSFAREGPLMDTLAHIPGVQVVRHQRLAWAKHTLRSPLKRLGDLLSLGINLPRVRSLLKHAQAFQPDIIHSNSLASLEGAVVAKLLRIPHVWHAREIFTDENPRFNLTLGEALGRWVITKASAQVICISQYVARQFDGANTVTIIPNAIELAPKGVEELNPKPLETLQLAYAGRVSEGKRFQDIVAALGQLKAQWEEPFPFVLNVYGEFIDPQFEQQMRHQITVLHLEDAIRFHGYVTPLEEALQGSHALIMPTANEAFGRVLLDAFAAGLPVVVPQGGAAPEIVDEGQTGFFYTPHQPSDLARVLQSMWAQRKTLSQMGPQCLDVVKTRYSVETQIQRLDTLYQACCKETTP